MQKLEIITKIIALIVAIIFDNSFHSYRTAPSTITGSEYLVYNLFFNDINSSAECVSLDAANFVL